jgi:site-specific recombinase XerD
MIPRLIQDVLNQTKNILRIRHYSIKTEYSYIGWIRDYAKFHDFKHPAQLSKEHVTSYLSYLAKHRNVAASTQNQALAALLFLYRHVLKQPFGWLDDVERAQNSRHIPVVLTRAEVKSVLSQIDGTPWLMANCFTVAACA